MEIQNLKLISKQNIRENISKYSDKKICLMVKANAYGHGLETIIPIVDDLVEAYGVVNIEEALIARKLTKKRIIIFFPVYDFDICKINKFEFMFDSEEMLLKAIECGCKHLLHFSVNVGMNRYGTKSFVAVKSIANLLKIYKIKLKSIYTHFSVTNSEKQTKKQYKKFVELKECFDANTPTCFGGSEIYNYNFDYQMLRLGICAYGYGMKDLRKVMKIISNVNKINFVKKGEYIGYGKKFKAKKDCYVAIVPVGYGDGLFRNLSGKFFVEINGKKYKTVGNICMDCFFVLVDKNVKVFDKVEVLSDADYFAKILNTIPYEILTNFSKLRGQTLLD